MKTNLIKGLVATAVLAALTGCNDSNSKNEPRTCADAGDQCVKFTILHTNDNHGRFWENKYGEYGMAARKTKVDEIRAEVRSDGGETLLLSGGDINTGVPESDLQDAEPDFIGMNRIQYDAMAVGNHEFDNPLDVLEKQRKWADFPMLAANIYHKVDGKLERMFDAYKVFEMKGVKVAVIGLTTKDTKTLGNPEYIKDIVFTDEQEEIKKVIKEIKDGKKADLIFATTHMGHFADGKHGINAPGDVALARALEEGLLHGIIGGHSQNPVCMEGVNKAVAKYIPGSECKPDQQNGTYIMQAHEWGKYVGRADFEYFDGKLNLASYKLEPINLKVKDSNGNRVLVADPIYPDVALRDELKQYQDKGQDKLNEVIGHTDGKLEGDRSVVRTQQTNMGQLIAEAQRTKVNADFAVMNSGGVRESIETGDITYRDVLTVQPFGNTITKSTMTGAQVTEYLNVVATVDIGAKGAGAYPQLAGIKMSVDCSAKKVTITDINGKGYSADANYTFTVPSYNAAGGDGYPKLTPVNTGYVDAEVLYTFIKAKKDILVSDFAPVDGDIQFLNSNSTKACKK
ncbi:bifunctional UDP-sugar hydrolase/5'-nucleotidase UshA [Parashewanella tropica]|uniref:bifunctional UDP-sugar hydrolase/5'-nucleotidase UshA n=1 Tax=Parashewanella tropica TaxID=2547970 RepID=UPI001059BF14|nr:bifunctional UDP-sugar hydrolase/5'-nucleotidase UshA [Parashewanella tropica]